MTEAHRQEISINEYHSRRSCGPWISHSATKYAYKIMPDKEWVWTPHLFKHYLSGKMKTFPTRDRDLGTIFHSICEGIDPKVLVSPVDRRGTKEWKAWLKGEAGRHGLPVKKLMEEYTILKENEDRKILEMYKSLKENKIVQEMMSDHRVAKEGTVRWEDPVTGLKLQARPDLETENYIIDYKTSSAAEDFLFSAYDLSYHRQAAMQVEGVKAVTGRTKKMRHIVIGKSLPYDCIVYELPCNAMELGRAEMREVYSHIRDWLDFDQWESPWQSRIVTTDFPAWIYRGKSF